MSNNHYMKAIETLGKRIDELELALWIKDQTIENLTKKLEEAENAGKGKE